MSKLLIVTCMPSFLPPLVKEMENAGHTVETFLFFGDRGFSEVSELVTRCNKADAILFEFAQHPVAEVTNHISGKPIFIRFWRCEMYNKSYLRKIKWSNVTKVFFSTKYMLENFLKFQKGKICPPCSLFRTPNVCPDTFKLVHRKFDTKEIKLGMLGNMIPRKRPFLATQLLTELPENFTLTYAGALKDEELACSIRSFAKAAGVEDRVRLLGEIPKEACPQFLGDIDVLLSLSTEETGHFAVAEGLMTGCYAAISYWEGCLDIYPKHLVSFKLSELVSRIKAWSAYNADHKLKISEELRSFAVDAFNNSGCKTIVSEVFP